MAICDYGGCGKEFTPTRKGNKYCCAVHRSYASRERQEQAAIVAAANRESEVVEMIAALSQLAPQAAMLMSASVADNGVDCAWASLKLCLSALHEYLGHIGDISNS